MLYIETFPTGQAIRYREKDRAEYTEILFIKNTSPDAYLEIILIALESFIERKKKESFDEGYQKGQEEFICDRVHED